MGREGESGVVARLERGSGQEHLRWHLRGPKRKQEQGV